LRCGLLSYRKNFPKRRFAMTQQRATAPESATSALLAAASRTSCSNNLTGGGVALRRLRQNKGLAPWARPAPHLRSTGYGFENMRKMDMAGMEGRLTAWTLPGGMP